MGLAEVIRKIETMPAESQTLVADFVDMLIARQQGLPFAEVHPRLRPYKRDERLRTIFGSIDAGGNTDNVAIDADLAREYSGE